MSRYHGVTRTTILKFRHPDDVQLLVTAFRAEGYHCTPTQAAEIWSKFSNHRDAGWLGVNSYMPPANLVEECSEFWQAEEI